MTRKVKPGVLTFGAVALASVFSAAVSLAAPSGSPDAGDPRGLWLRQEGGVQFSFYDCNGLLCAKVVAAKRAEDQKGVGTVILRGAQKTADNEWRGKLFNSEDGRTYEGVITLKSAKELSLKGCVLGVLCGGETWTRIGSAPKPQTSAALAQ